MQSAQKNKKTLAPKISRYQVQLSVCSDCTSAAAPFRSTETSLPLTLSEKTSTCVEANFRALTFLSNNKSSSAKVRPLGSGDAGEEAEREDDDQGGFGASIDLQFQNDGDREDGEEDIGRDVDN
jgi:hypothetical protein